MIDAFAALKTTAQDGLSEAVGVRGFTMRSRGRRPNRRGSNIAQMMRMRGLEPPPSYLDTDLNREQPGHMRPWASGSSVLCGFADASDDMTVAKLLSRVRRRQSRA